MCYFYSYIRQSDISPSVTSLPSNQLLTLKYNVPGSDETIECTEDCSLSTDSSVAFQDFLFTSPPIFGVQINLKEWTGAGAGLHLLQLLSDGLSSFRQVIDTPLTSIYHRLLRIGRCTRRILVLLAWTIQRTDHRFMDIHHCGHLYSRHHPNSLNQHSQRWLNDQHHLEYLYISFRAIRRLPSLSGVCQHARLC